ncbi:ComEA family DNA-binding protein [Belliella kenyensis]|uniref:ComEA family DNA-binding protein n=1 Tax=Belliella kenyensis TaxID=1472724 RepID=A0ABV8EHK6_9BACT|nr:helix-hairpin-helix domain-containing protein [Belliella kenyensis]MCH7403842.1 helix-hairpin-helix domain-containing protein [Belliella kenyensis]MDN3603820.1 helix-hairpin-helix domain-containing protein [Belliella kenyensis]
MTYRKLSFLLKRYFGLTHRESRGFIFILPAVAVLYAVPLIYSGFFISETKFDLEFYRSQIDSLQALGWVEVASLPYYEQEYQDSIKKAKRNQNNIYKKMKFDEADSLVLQIVPGIGQTMASRIVKFRDALGGMIAPDQLMDVYGMNEELNERIFEYFDFTPGVNSFIKINLSDVQELSKHPYINYGSAKVIVAYRQHHGDYRSADDLKKIRIFTDQWIEKISPYLEF